ncbi:MAG: MFS transporter [Paenarthrobacter ureafaciens]|uniref:MFS transporter n=1 Tax=Paenarthrobacter ureafaciens TaxID=37931 RepID=UPI001AC03B7F|nr:MFS transporter [Paenarthrobacter ureafaciens]MBN9131733.1 MFS transporter [Paenarthrobacter ureafaciens]
MNKKTAWTTGSTALLLFAVLGAHVGVWASQLPAVADKASFSLGDIGLRLMVVSVASIVASLLVGRVIDSLGRRVFSVLGLLVMAASFLLFGSSNLEGLMGMAIFLLFGVAIGILDVAVNTVGSDYERSLKRPLMIGLHGAFSAGAAVAAGLCALFLGIGSDGLLLTTGVLMFLSAVWVGFAKFPAMPSVEAESAEENIQPSNFKFFGLPLVIVAIGTICFFGDGILEGFAPLYFSSDLLNASAELTALAVGSFHFASFAGRVVSAFVFAKFGRDLVIILWSGLGCGLSVTFFIAFTDSPYFALVGMVLAGFLLSPVIPTTYSALGRLGGTVSGRAISWLTSGSYAAFTVAPAVSGFVAQSSSLRTPIIIAGVCYIACAIFALTALLNKADAPLKETVDA